MRRHRSPNPKKVPAAFQGALRTGLYSFSIFTSDHYDKHQDAQQQTSTSHVQANLNISTCTAARFTRRSVHTEPMSTAAVTWGRPPPRLFTFTLTTVALALIAHPLLPALPSELLDIIPFEIPPQPAFPALQANLGFSLLAFVGAIWAVPFVSEAFAAKGLKGRDQCKPGGRTAGPWV